MLDEQTITFAAICQITHLVQKLSHTGQLSDEDLSVFLNSITVTSPNNTLDVYGANLANLQLGLSLVVKNLNGKEKTKDAEFTRYMVGLLNLERQLSKKPKSLQLLGERIIQVDRQLAHYEITSDTLLSSFASIYSDVISPLATKIRVTGDPVLLKQTINQHKIRALLLAGVRSAFLWRQVGGQRRKILFSRTKIVNSAEALLKEIENIK